MNHDTAFIRAAIVSEADLEMARRHVENARLRIGNQRKLIALLAAQRRPLRQAKEVLSLLEKTLQSHSEHLANLEALKTHRSPVRLSRPAIESRSEAA